MFSWRRQASRRLIKDKQLCLRKLAEETLLLRGGAPVVRGNADCLWWMKRLISVLKSSQMSPPHMRGWDLALPLARSGL